MVKRLAEQDAPEHTPGPWQVREDGNDPQEIAICAPWGSRVEAGTAAGFGDYRGIIVSRVAWNDEWAEPTIRANARLIAAAPDLLEAAISALHCITHGVDPEGCLAELNAAIAKAEGGQS